MPGFGQRLRLRLFLEGVEVPVISASIQVLPNSPATCSLQLPPLPQGTKLFPRTLVHLFFYDPYAPLVTTSLPATNTSPTAYQQGLAPDPNPSSLPQSSDAGDQQDVQDQSYRLLFGGETVGFTWTKNQAQRSLVLQCLDWSNYWDYAYQWQNTDLFGPGLKAMFSGGSTSLFTDFLENEGDAILRIIQTKSVQYPQLNGLLGGIVHLLEAIGGSYYTGKTFAGENIFFSIAELRLHLTQMITAYDKDPTAFRLLGAGYDSLLGRTLGDLGQQVSFRQAINALMGVIFHETYAQPCPYFIPSSTQTQSSSASIRSNPSLAFIGTIADSLSADIDLAITEINSGGPDNQTAARQLLDGVASRCGTTANQVPSSLPTVRAQYVSAQNSVLQAEALVIAWDPNTGGNNSNAQNAISFLHLAQTQLEKAGGATTTSYNNVQNPARLCQQIFRPDVWFSAPPTCNVIFPEHYHTLTYTRQFLTEPTRLLLKTNDEFYGEDELFDQFYYAPKGFSIKGSTESRELQQILNGGILDHELFTGILPVFEKMGELNIFGARSGNDSGQNQKIGLAQKSCNFLYFKYRFAARQLQLQGKFNPYLACGFPAVVLDKPVDQATLALHQQLLAQNGDQSTPETNELLATNFLCNLTEVDHSVSQTSGQTTLSCSYARQPEEAVEFLGAIRPDQTVQKRSGADAVRVTVAAALQAPTVQSLGPNLGVITQVQDVTSAYQASSVATGRQLPVYQGPKQAGTSTPSISAPVGVTAPASAYGTAVVSYVGSSSQPVMFRAYRITEQVPRYSKVSTDLPAEEYIRPGWYGDCWAPANIGQVYQQFFGIGSITDQTLVSTTPGGASGASNQAMQQALAQSQQATSSDDPLAQAPGLLALDQGSSIQDAVNFLVTLYSTAQQQGASIDDLIQAMTWRPIATLTDLFGSSDLQFDATGSTVVSGIEGFHSRAFGSQTGLVGLTTPNINTILGMATSATSAQKVDTRARKRKAVEEYLALLSTRGIRG